MAFELKRGERLKVINTHGSQVLDTWAFSLDDMYDYMSMEHSRSATSRLTPVTGDTFFSVSFKPMLKILEDTSPGVHDTLMCCCSKRTYERLNCVGYHDNCQDNFHTALAAVNRSFPVTPAPLNLFMNFPVSSEGVITREPPVSKPGDYVLFQAEADILVVFSACPQDVIPINGVGKMPTDAAYQILPDATHQAKS